MRNKIDLYIATAMKNGEKDRLEVLKLIKAEFQKASHSGKPWDENRVMRSMIKSRDEASKIYKNAGREDLAEKENYEIQVILEYLPHPAASPDEIRAEILLAISEIGEVSLKDTKRIVSMVSAKYPEVTGREVSEVIKSL